MWFVENKTTFARIEVQQRFCETCAFLIKKELQEIDDVKHIKLYPKDSLITFSFTSANKLSSALNTLSEIGYYEKGELHDNKF